MKKVIVPLAEGFEEIEAVTIIDVLRRAGIAVETLSVGLNTGVMGSHGIMVLADRMFEEANFEDVSMVVLPGGMPGSVNLKNHAGLQEVILAFNRSGRYLAAICAAPLVFGELGLLNGRKATCFPGFEQRLHGAELAPDPVVCDGNVITGRSAGYALYFALKLVEILMGRSVAEETGRKLLAGGNS